MTHLVRVLRDSVGLHHNSESSTLCQIHPLMRATTVLCPSLPFDNQPCRCLKLRCLHHQPLFVFSVGKRSSTERAATVQAVHCTDLPHHWAGIVKLRLPLLLCVNTRLFQPVARRELKVLFHCGCLCRELLGVPSGEGSGLWFRREKCSASLPSKPDLETCLLSTHGESSLKFHGTWTRVYSRDLYTYCNITPRSSCEVTFTEQ